MQMGTLAWNIHDNPRFESGGISDQINPAEFAIIVDVWRTGEWERGQHDLPRPIDFPSKIGSSKHAVRRNSHRYDHPKRLIPRAIGHDLRRSACACTYVHVYTYVSAGREFKKHAGCTDSRVSEIFWSFAKEIVNLNI